MDTKSVKRVIEASKKVAPELPMLAFSQDGDRVMAFAFVPESKRGTLKVCTKMLQHELPWWY